MKCRMCENKIIGNSDDGLCVMCHMSLCQKEAEDCKRCVDICDGLIKWMKFMDK